MFHTDPTFRALLLALAESDPPDLSVLPALADWLEERGDGRAGRVRQIMSMTDAEVVPNDDGPLLDLLRRTLTGRARRVLALFPEGPRWRVDYRRQNGDRERTVDYLTHAEAHGKVRRLKESDFEPFRFFGAYGEAVGPSWGATPAPYGHLPV